uniref:Uncharacterized protein n=1 Tax=Juglanconis sp. TaxID=2041886 RepID=A0A291LJ58_9PEZI|nr:hypothetical protein [Juglanconis sp.]
MNSIKTSKGNNGKGQPAVTNREKNSKPCFWNPNIVDPKTIVKLIEKVNTKWLVYAKLYGLSNRTYSPIRSDYILAYFNIFIMNFSRTVSEDPTKVNIYIHIITLWFPANYSLFYLSLSISPPPYKKDIYFY